jgi:hypothetical protein
MPCSFCKKGGHYAPSCPKRREDKRDALTEDDCQVYAVQDDMEGHARALATVQAKSIDLENVISDMRADLQKLTLLFTEGRIGRATASTLPLEEALAQTVEDVKMKPISDPVAMFDPDALAYYAVRDNEQIGDKITALVTRVELTTKNANHVARGNFVKETVLSLGKAGVTNPATYAGSARQLELLDKLATQTNAGQGTGGVWSVFHSLEKKDRSSEEWRREEVRLDVSRMAVQDVANMGGAVIPSGGYDTQGHGEGRGYRGGARASPPRGRGRGRF